MTRPQDAKTRAPVGSEHGTGAELDRLAHAGPLATGGGEVPSAPGPLNRAQVQRGQPLPIEYASPDDIASQSDVGLHANPNENLGLDEQLFAPTDQPDTPITNGMPFGEGASAQPSPGETPRMFRTRVADQIMQTPGGAQDARVRQFAAAIAQGR